MKTVKEVAIIDYQDGTQDFILSPDAMDWQNASSIVFGLSGNFTGRTPTQAEFEEAWTLMEDEK